MPKNRIAQTNCSWPGENNHLQHEGSAMPPVYQAELEKIKTIHRAEIEAARQAERNWTWATMRAAYEWKIEELKKQLANVQ